MADKAKSNGAAEAEPITLDAIIDNGKLVRMKADENASEEEKKAAEEQERRAKGLVAEFVRKVKEEAEADEGIQKDADLLAFLKNKIAEIDNKIAAQVNEILHHEDFQRLEAAWRGLHYLVKNSETGERMKLRLLPMSKKELHKDLTTASDYDQSALFKKVYEEEYGTFGGNPFSLMVADYEFTRHPQDLELLREVAGVAAGAHAPFIAGAAPALFDMDSFTELGKPRDLSKIFESSELASWRSFRADEDSRYVTLVLPRFLLRLPYGDKTTPVEEFALEELSPVDVEEEMAVDDPIYDPDHKNYLWGNAAYALTQRITAAFAKYSWCAAIRGVEGGGVVSKLPLHNFKTGEGDKINKCPTEVTITDRREKELSDLGFISLVHCKGTDYAVFFGGQTAQKPKKYDTNQATANANISARLPYMLAASRFAHYLKVMCRDKIGSFQSQQTMSLYLNRWIQNYVLATDEAGQDLKAKFPLREARVDVTDVPGNPGAFRAIAFLRPHFQLEELTTSIRLVAELPPPAA